jgi:protein arginine kinase
MNKWFEKAGEYGDVAVSTRIRLARNISKYPFPCKLNSGMKSAVINDINAALLEADFENYNFNCISTSEASPINLKSLVECHLVSPEFIKPGKFKAVFLSNANDVSIMVNEEDHIRLQAMKEGLALEETYKLADEIDSRLDKTLKFAFNDQFGYLTQCPTNLGTGMRASIMLHLPALRKCGMIDKISSSLIKLGLTIRGLYGEGSEPKGDLYQISNQVTLGISEKTALKNLNDITLQIITQERNCRKELAKNIQVKDSICRSVGILKTAKLLNNDESMNLISNVRLGLSMGLLKGISYDVLNEISTKSQPFTLMQTLNAELSNLQRDQKRAELMNEKFGTVEIL